MVWGMGIHAVTRLEKALDCRDRAVQRASCIYFLTKSPDARRVLHPRSFSSCMEFSLPLFLAQQQHADVTDEIINFARVARAESALLFRKQTIYR